MKGIAYEFLHNEVKVSLWLFYESAYKFLRIMGVKLFYSYLVKEIAYKFLHNGNQIILYLFHERNCI